MIQRLQAKRNEEGFTLIELLIVIIVLGILAAIVVFAIGSTRKDSVASSCKTNFKAVELSAEAVNTNSGGYPATDAQLLNSGGKGGLLRSALSTGSDYSIVYAPTGTVQANGLYPGYTITVKDAAAATKGTTADACGLL